MDNSLADYHHVRQALGEIFKGKWISTGISKGGQTTSSIAAAVISRVSADGTESFFVAIFPYCGRSSRKRLLQANTDTQEAEDPCPLRVLQQLAAKDATEAADIEVDE